MIKWYVKYLGLTWGGHIRLVVSSEVEEGGISGVAVKCVDIRRNTCGVDGFLDHY